MDSVKTEIEVDPEISELVPFFLNARNKDLDQMDLLSRNNDFEEMARICHTIKGIARPYGFPSLEALAREMEQECKIRNVARASELLEKMQSFLRNYSRAN